jgi:pyruvate/2-oxoglutarate dehydrogenase complex dihydrolipoamide acyltransferase (E2) component
MDVIIYWDCYFYRTTACTTFLNYHGSFVREEGSMEDYIIMCAMYPTMTSGKVDKFLVRKGDKVVPGTAVAEIISEGYFTLLSEVEGVVTEFYVQEQEYVEVDTAIIEIKLKELEEK